MQHKEEQTALSGGFLGTLTKLSSIPRLGPEHRSKMPRTMGTDGVMSNP
jgi:hypothetical protein